MRVRRASGESLKFTYWNDGNLDVGPFDMEKGESIDIELEFMFAGDLQAKDWSLIAYGEKQELAIKIDGNKQARAENPFPVIEANQN